MATNAASNRPAPAPASARTVTAFEARLLRILAAILTPGSSDAVRALIAERQAAPKILTPACVDLVRDTLAKGCVRFLAKEGGWRRDRFLNNGSAETGRLWERHGPVEIPLAFSKHSLAFLIWLTAHRPQDVAHLELPANELTPADQLLLFLAFLALDETNETENLRKLAAFQAHGLVRLAFPESFDSAPDPDFSIWLSEPRSIHLEALQLWLAERWKKMDRAKREIIDWERMLSVGKAQERVLSLYIDAAEAAGRPDLVRFLLLAGIERLPAQVDVSSFLGGLSADMPERLADQIATKRHGLVLPRMMVRLRQWHDRALTVGFVDEGYAVSQFWKSEWDRYHGAAMAERAENLLREIEPLQLQ